MRRSKLQVRSKLKSTVGEILGRPSIQAIREQYIEGNYIDFYSKYTQIYHIFLINWCYGAGGKRWILADVDYSRRESHDLRTA